MSKNYTPSSLDYTNAITDSYSGESKALSVVTVNNLVPVRFGRVEVSYITSGQGAGNVRQARYYSNGVYHETRIICKGDELGSAHKTTINFINRTAASLAGKAFVLYDSNGPVKVWFNVDFSNSEPNPGDAPRTIEVNLLSSHDHETIARRTAQTLSLDAEFLAVYSMYYVIISSRYTGIKKDSYDLNTGMFVKNSPGSEPTTLNNKAFTLNSALNVNRYYVWFNVDGAGIDPLLPNKTGIMVSLSKGANAETVAQSIKNALDSTEKFITNINSDTLIVTNSNVGETSIATDVNTSFLLFTQKLGENRELLAILNMEYDNQNNIISVERV